MQKKYPEMMDSIFIGDKAVDVCGALGVYCKAMSTGQVPMIEERYPFSNQMECTHCIATAKRKLLYYTAKKMNINHIVLEKSGGEFDPADMADELRELGYQIDVLDFTESVSVAVRKAGEIFDRQRIAEKVVEKYEREMEEVQAAMPVQLGKRVLVLMGLDNHHGPDTYLLAEQPGGDVDEHILKPSGCTSVGEYVAGDGSSGLGFTVLKNLDNLYEANPDVIALLCDSFVGQTALHKALAADPKLSELPAIKNQEVFSLPLCSPGVPLELPDAMRRWIKALS